MANNDSDNPWGMIGAVAGVVSVIVAVFFGVAQCSSSGSSTGRLSIPDTGVSSGTTSTSADSTSTYGRTSPSARASPEGTPTTEESVETPMPSADAPTPSEAFLADMNATDVTPSTGSQAVNGQSLPHSVYGRIGGCSDDVSFVYNIGRDWASFNSTVGVGDDSDTDSVVQFEVYADNALVASSGNVGYGQSSRITVSVAGALSLKLRYLFVDGDKGLCSNAGYAVWGDATLSK